MDIFEVIRKPWKEPVLYSELVFWFVVFLIAAYATADGMRIAIQYISGQAREVLN